MDDSFQNGLTAGAGGTQAVATLISRTVSRFTTVVTAGDSGLLPAASAGLRYTVINAHATNSMNVFPGVGDAINNGAVNAAFAVANLKTATFFCAVNGTWNALLSA